MEHTLLLYRSRNLGDIMQSLALSRLLPPCKGIFRHRLQTLAPGQSLIVNGMFDKDRPPAFGAHCLFAGVSGPHFRQSFYLRWMAQSPFPIGARDPATADAANAVGLTASLIGCATLTLPPYHGPRKGIYSVDTIGPGVASRKPSRAAGPSKNSGPARSPPSTNSAQPKQSTPPGSMSPFPASPSARPSGSPTRPCMPGTPPASVSSKPWASRGKRSPRPMSPPGPGATPSSSKRTCKRPSSQAHPSCPPQTTGPAVGFPNGGAGNLTASRRPRNSIAGSAQNSAANSAPQSPAQSGATPDCTRTRPSGCASAAPLPLPA